MFEQVLEKAMGHCYSFHMLAVDLKLLRFVVAEPLQVRAGAAGQHEQRRPSSDERTDELVQCWGRWWPGREDEGGKQRQGGHLRSRNLPAVVVGTAEGGKRPGC